MLSRDISESAEVTHPGLSDMAGSGAGQVRRSPLTRAEEARAPHTRINNIV